MDNGFFLWGKGGEKLTPEDIQRAREEAAQYTAQGRQTPAYNWAQGAANMLDSFLGGFENGRADKAQQLNDDYSKATVAALSGDGAFGGAGTDARDPQVNPYLGSDEAMKLAGPQDQSDPFAGVGTDAANPFTRDTETPSGISPVAHALVASAQPTVGQAAQAGASDILAQGLIEHIRRAESGGDANATNPNSSATGDFQFTNPTWTALRQQHPELGLTADGRTDPAQSQVAAKQLATDNLAYMLAHGVQAPTEGQAYLAHFAGAPTATNLVQADPNTPISQIMSPQQVAANPFLRGMTAGQVQDWAAQKMGGSGTPPAQAQQAGASISAPQQPAFASYADTGPSISQLGAILTDPRLNTSAKSFASVLLQNKMQQNLLMQQERLRQSDPLYRAQINSANALTDWRTGKMNNTGLTGRMQQADEYARSRGLPPGSNEYNQAVDFFLKSGGTNVSVNTGNGGIADAASKAYATKSGENLAAQEQDGEKSGSLMGLGKTLEYLAPQIGGGGLTAEMANRLGAYMPDGWKPQGQGQREQFQSLVSDAIRQSHVPGEGPQSDADAARLSATMPQIMNSTQGNIAIARTIQALAQRKMDMGRLAGQQGRGEITPAQRAEAVRNLPDPYAAVRSFWQTAQNPNQPAASSQPAPQPGTRTTSSGVTWSVR
ncbi:hypothetical protein [Acetobacter okinawensis]|uniref:Transglycosylase SLT domain-containing protein n=1 Tax=Acetobacter okinawensis TaxID=1076594 RepID=A0A252BXY3_9PROT|nr:hypothetical protein [Acetobacter okinawensis]OUJ13814.1 hypothetical protein HK26_03960 [Acetobacter okinawensis]